MNQIAVETNKWLNSKHIGLRSDPEHRAIWMQLKHPDRPCMSRELLEEAAAAQSFIAETARRGYEQGDKNRLLYEVVSSTRPGVFSLGGDLAYFIELVKTGDRDALLDYAKACIDVLYPASVSFELPFTTIALVQGEALGGGFEAALSANVLIAEQNSAFGFPETVFGLFPGMGAFSFLARRMAPSLAKRIIASGRVYTAEELYDMGVVDVLAPVGKGVEAVYEYIGHQQNRNVGFQCLDRVADQFNPLSYKELMDVVNLWVEAALQLTPKNLRLMEYLVNAQERRWGRIEEPQRLVAV